MPRKVTKKQDVSDSLKKEAPSKEIAVTLPLNAQEQAMVDKWRQGEEKSQVPLKFGVEITPTNTIFNTKLLHDRGSSFDRQGLINATFCVATGATNATFADKLFISCAAATGILDRDKPEELVKNSDAILNALYAMKPQDEVEGMLITRLIGLHFQSMNYLASSSDKNTATQVREMHLNRSAKLIRLYNETLEALMRYRRKGMQQVVVQHVNVENGGQAIVGHVQTGGGVNKKD